MSTALEKRSEAFLSGIAVGLLESGFSKQAVNATLQDMAISLTKQAELPSEVIGGLLSSIGPMLLPGAAGAIAGPAVGLATLGGSLGAAVTPTRTKEEQRKAEEHGLLNLIPGVNAYNMFKRVGRTGADWRDKHPEEMSGAVPEYLGMNVGGPLVGGLAGAGVGALGGAAIDPGAVIPGALIGGAAGLAVPTLIALLAAAIKRRRTAKEQEESEKTPGALNMLVPGLGTYNWWKRLGHSQHYADEARKMKEKR